MKRLLTYGLLLVVACVVLIQKRHEMIGIAAVALFVIAFSLMLSPICERLEKRGIRPSMAAMYTVIGFSLIVLLIIAAFIPYLASHTVYIFKRISPIASALMHKMGLWAEETGIAQIYRGNSTGLGGLSLGQLTGAAARFSMTAAAQTGRIAFSLVLTYYVLCDRRRIGCHLLLLVPYAWRRAVLTGLCGCRNAVLSYFSGVLKTSAFISAATAIALVVLGIQDAFLLALFMGIFEILPYVGPALAAAAILLSGLTQGYGTAIGALILIVLIQQIEGNFVSPYFTASSTSVHPLAAIAGVFVLGSLMGVWGILLATPLLVISQSILWSVRRIRYMAQEDGVVSMKRFTS